MLALAVRESTCREGAQLSAFDMFQTMMGFECLSKECGSHRQGLKSPGLLTSSVTPSDTPYTVHICVDIYMCGYVLWSPHIHNTSGFFILHFKIIILANEKQYLINVYN